VADNSNPGVAPVPTPWWSGAVGYEVYIRSFADSTGDGVGDLRGIESHLDHIAWLGARIVWITPFMPSPGFDHGYDVSDYRDIDPAHGSMDDFRRLVERAHDLDLRVLVDIVPNHTSSAHPWFIDSISGPDSARRDWYHWADPGPDGGPPNNWVSHFGGPAWTLDPASGQYYCHLFLPEQPDLNWSNPAVVEEFDDVLRFWCDAGADGFRIDVAHALLKHPELLDNPVIRATEPEAGPTAVFESFRHDHDLDQDANIEIFRRWRRLTEPYGAMLVGEVNVRTPQRAARYTAPGALDTVFYLKPAWADWEPSALVDMLRSTHDADPDGVSWTMNSHDTSRSVSRFGGGEVGRRRSFAATAFEFVLGGVPFLYQGEELGLVDATLDPGDRADPIWTRNAGGEAGRDGSRSAMPWTTGSANGFSTGTPWLAAAERPAEETVEHQRGAADAPVHAYRALISARAANPDLHLAPLEWLSVDRDDAAAGRRGDCAFVANLGSESITVDLVGDHEIVFCSTPDGAMVHGSEVTVAPETTVYLRRTS
jgi:alpha-glucosidase